jgi:hypothetical protein
MPDHNTQETYSEEGRRKRFMEGCEEEWEAGSPKESSGEREELAEDQREGAVARKYFSRSR